MVRDYGAESDEGSDQKGLADETFLLRFPGWSASGAPLLALSVTR